MSTEHLIDRPAYASRCPRCTAPVLIGIDGGLDAVTDIIPADVNTEIAAWLARRWSFNVIRDPYLKQTHLRFRGLPEIRAGRHYPVVTGHRCPDGASPLITWQPPDKDKPRPSRVIRAAVSDGPVPF